MSVAPSAVEIAKARELKIEPDGAQGRGVGDVVVAYVFDLECAGGGAPQEEVGGVAAEESAEPGDLEIGSHLAQKVRRQERVAADVIDFIEPVGVVAQDHVRRGAGGRRWVRSGGHEKALEAAAVAVTSNDLARIVDAECLGVSAQGIIEREVGAAAQAESVRAAGITVKPDDLACVVDAEGLGASGGQGIIQRGEGAAA
jgi:hypothetical protein